MNAVPRSGSTSALREVIAAGQKVLVELEQPSASSDNGTWSVFDDPQWEKLRVAANRVVVQVGLCDEAKKS